MNSMIGFGFISDLSKINKNLLGGLLLLGECGEEFW